MRIKITIFFVASFCFIMLMLPVKPSTAACCGHKDVRIGPWDVLEYSNRPCPNSPRFCMLRKREGRATPSCTLGMCIYHPPYSCVVENGGRPVVWMVESCAPGKTISTLWEEWQIKDPLECDPYDCFNRCRTAVGMIERRNKDCSGSGH